MAELAPCFDGPEALVTGRSPIACERRQENGLGDSMLSTLAFLYALRPGAPRLRNRSPIGQA